MMEPVRILVLATTRFALPVIQQLLMSGELVAVGIPEEQKELAGEVEAMIAGSAVTSDRLTEAGWKKEIATRMESAQITLALVLTFPYFIPQVLIQKPVHGFYNIHPGRLPEYRGADPVFEQLRNGETFAGVALHKLTEGADDGPVVIQEKIRIQKEDTHGLLTMRLAGKATGLVQSLLQIVRMGFTVPGRTQDESKARYYPRISEKDLLIRWEEMSADQILFLMQACNPWNKGAATQIASRLIRFLEAEKTEFATATSAVPGTILSLDQLSADVISVTGEIIRIHYIYMNEGYMPAGRLAGLGVSAGMKFETIHLQ